MTKKTSKKSNYWRASRDLAVSYVFIIPLVALYEVGVLFVADARNGAAPILRGLFEQFGLVGILILVFVFLALLFFSIGRAQDVRIGRPGIYGAMFCESFMWGMALYAVGGILHPLTQLAIPTPMENVIAAAGAGVYEEAIFRFILLGGFLLLLQKGLSIPYFYAAAVALVLSAALFSYAHSAIGNEELIWGRFYFRASMGLLLGLLYLGRGLGVTVYTHALYNVAVSLGAGD